MRETTESDIDQVVSFHEENCLHEGTHMSGVGNIRLIIQILPSYIGRQGKAMTPAVFGREDRCLLFRRK